MKLILFLYLLVTLASSSFDQSDNPQEISFIVRLWSQKKITHEQNLTLLYSPKFFDMEADRLPIKFTIPREILNTTALQIVRLPSRQNEKPLAKAWKLTNQVYLSKRNYGLSTIFGVNSHMMSSQEQIEQAFPQTIYLKIFYQKETFEGQHKNVSPAFTINQDLLQHRKQFKSIQQVQNFAEISIVPQLFTFYAVSHKNSEQFLNTLQSYNTIFDKVYLKAHNQPVTQQQIATFLYILQLYLLQQKVEAPTIYQLIKSQSGTHTEQEIKTYSYVKNLLFSFLSDILQFIKKLIFFNQSGFLTNIVFLDGISLYFKFICEFIFFFIIVKGLFQNYQDYAGISVTAIYIYIITQLSYGWDNINFDLIIMASPLLGILYRKVSHFPYWSSVTNRVYKRYRSLDIQLLFLNAIVLLLLLTGYYFLYEKPINKDVKYIYVFDKAEIIRNLITEYSLFFLILNQYFVNKKLKSVRHLTKGYMVMLLLLVLSDNLQIFVQPKLFYILLKLKEDIVALLIVYQCLKWNDLGKGSRKYFTELQKEEYMKQREKQLLTLRKKVD